MSFTVGFINCSALNRFDIFGSSLTFFEESCSAITSGDFATTQEINLAWNTDFDGASANATLAVNGLGISLAADMPSDWFGWQRITHLFFTVGDADTAADTEVVLSGLFIRNSEDLAVGCSGSWVEDGTCVVATRDVAVTAVSWNFCDSECAGIAGVSQFTTSESLFPYVLFDC